MAIKLSGSTIIDDSRNIIDAGIVTATRFTGDGSSLTGIVTSIAAGSGISIDRTNGAVTITATGGVPGEGGSGIALTSFSVATGVATVGGSLSYNNTNGVFTFNPALSGGGGGGIALTDLSVITGVATTSGSLSYNNTNGVFTFNPPNLSSYLTSVSASDLNNISIDALSDVDTSTTPPSTGQVLKWNGSSWTPAADATGGGGSGIALTSFSVTVGVASTGGSLSYNNTNGVFTFNPAENTFLGLTDTPNTFTASKYLAVNSAGNAIEFVNAPAGGGGSLSVGTRTGNTDNNDLVTGVTEIRFTKAPFSVTDLGNGKVFIITESSFNPIILNGNVNDKVQASGEETLNIIAGTGITITANNTSNPKSLTFSATGGGGASSLSGLSDVDFSTAPTNGKVLKYNGTAWVPATDATGGGGGGGAGDGTIPLGTPPDGSYTGGLIGLTDASQVNEAIDEMNEVLAKLAPTKPVNLSTKTLSITTYSVKKSGTNELITNAIDNQRPETSNVDNFFDGDTGTLSFEVDGAADGSRVLTAANDTGTYGGLTINSDTDPFSGVAGKEGFWKQLSAKVRASTNLSQGVTHTYQLKHSATGNTPVLSFFVDDPGAVTISGQTVDATAAAADLAYVSGVPTYKAGNNVSASFTINNAVRKAYNSTKIADITGAQLNTNNISPGASYTEGEAIALTDQLASFRSNVYSESLSLSIKGYNSKGVAGTSVSAAIPGRIDTVSNETTRKTSGTGLYPASGYGDTYDSTQSLASNSELQMINGAFKYPNTNYSTTLNGPNYSALSGIRYVTFQVAGPSNKQLATLTINATGLTQKNASDVFISVDNIGEIKIQLKLVGVGAWHDCNAAWTPSGNKDNDGFKAVNASTTTNHLQKKLTLGDYYTAATAFVRIGLAAGSTASITGVTLTY